MIRFAALFLIFAVSPIAFGGGSSVHHYMATKMTCVTAQRVVGAEGAVILHFGNELFERVVSNRDFCEGDEEIMPRLMPTADTRECFVGMSCKPYQVGGGGEGN